MNRVRNIMLALPRFEGSAQRPVVKKLRKSWKNVPYLKNFSNFRNFTDKEGSFVINLGSSTNAGFIFILE
jgi:hypothetical protein